MRGSDSPIYGAWEARSRNECGVLRAAFQLQRRRASHLRHGLLYERLSRPSPDFTYAFQALPV